MTPGCGVPQCPTQAVARVGRFPVCRLHGELIAAGLAPASAEPIRQSDGLRCQTCARGGASRWRLPFGVWCDECRPSTEVLPGWPPRCYLCGKWGFRLAAWPDDPPTCRFHLRRALLPLAPEDL